MVFGTRELKYWVLWTLRVWESQPLFRLSGSRPAISDPGFPNTQDLRTQVPNTMKGMVFGIYIYIYIHIRNLVPKAIEGMVFGTRVLKYWVLGPLGKVELFSKLLLSLETGTWRPEARIRALGNTGAPPPVYPDCPDTLLLLKGSNMIPFWGVDYNSYKKKICHNQKGTTFEPLGKESGHKIHND